MSHPLPGENRPRSRFSPGPAVLQLASGCVTLRAGLRYLVQARLSATGTGPRYVRSP